MLIETIKTAHNMMLCCSGNVVKNWTHLQTQHDSKNAAEIEHAVSKDNKKKSRNIYGHIIMTETQQYHKIYYIEFFYIPLYNISISYQYFYHGEI